MKQTIIICAVLLAVVSRCSANQPDPPAAVRALRLSDPVRIDGSLTESVWTAQGLNRFYQREPEQGKPASEETEVWFAYDDGALYVAARMHDQHPDSVVARLARRDYDSGSDEFVVFLDPYHDRRTGFYFGITAAGSQKDGVLYNDDWDDNSWDGVWEGSVQRDDHGWTAEFRIPFSQLRFEEREVQVWGVNAGRFVARRNEQSYIVYRPRNESGFVSRFPELIGIEQIRPPQRFEAVPYVTARAEYLQHSTGDPFNDGSRYAPGAGLDIKAGLGSNLTLDATFNPDFGQVEVDPAVVNLSDVESYFSEKRPFFIEGASIFSFGRGGSNSNWSFNWAEPELFYSRRIGRMPQGSLPDHDYADLPLGTHILGAGKLTGRLGGDWKIGTIQSVTKREYARVSTNGVRSDVEIEPMAYYGIARVQKDVNAGRQGIGVMATMAARSFDDQRLRAELNSHALVAGVDGWTFLDEEKVYVVTGWAAVSHVRGSRERILALQRSSSHYYQRPDAPHVHVDSTATVLNGFAGRLTLNKQKGSFYTNAALGVIDPGFDPNDMGFSWRGDVVNAHTAIGYRWSDPTEYYRYVDVKTAIFGSWDFGGNRTWSGWWGMAGLQFPEYTTLYLRAAYNPVSVDNRRTRGGPLTLNPVGHEYGFELSTDSRRWWVLQCFGQFYEGGGISRYFESSIEFKPSSNITVSVGPGWSDNLDEAQWIGAFADPSAAATYGNRYVFGTIRNRTLSANLRMNWTLSPTLSLQVFAQPLFSSGDYEGLKELLRPKSFDFRIYGRDGSTIAERTDTDGNKHFMLDPDGTGSAPVIDIDDPDFNFRSLRGNAVLRWEYSPGSTLYLVWTQSRSDAESIGDFRLGRSFNRLIDARPDNIFMLKLTYWWGR